MANVPGFKYLGPGNSIYKGDPNNEADLIAQIHDIEYTLAQTHGDIRKADLEEIIIFHNIENPFDFGRLLGKYGLAAKYGIESLVGVLYGGNEKNMKRNLGQLLYAERQREIHETYKQSKGKYKNFYEFLHSAECKAIYPKYSKGSENYKRIKTQVEKDPYLQLHTDDQPSTSKQAEASDTNTRQPDDNRAGGSESERRPGDDSIDCFLANLDSSLHSSDLAALPHESSMDIPQSGSGRGPNTISRDAASTVSSTGSFSNGRSDSCPWISRPISQHPTVMTFQKSRIFYSYGYANHKIESHDLVDIFTTPLALIPVDFLPFYISMSEYSNLPIDCTIELVWCNVYPLGTRTAFDTGTTLSGTATSEYVPIGVFGIGLNLDFHGQNSLIRSNDAKPMIPTDVESMSATDICEKYYLKESCTSMGIPRSISQYFCLICNKTTNPDATKYPDYQIHEEGSFELNNTLSKFLINGLINTPIIDYKYNVKCGDLKNTKLHYIPHTKRNNKLYLNKSRGTKNSLQFFKETTTTIDRGLVGLSGKRGDVEACVNSIDNNYKRQLETYGTYTIKNGSGNYTAQPQVHVGLLATRQLNPTNNDTNFLNSTCYWRVECGITIKHNYHSAFTQGKLLAWPQEVSFKPLHTYSYTTGETLFGQIIQPSGNISTMKDVLSEYEIVKPKKKT